MAHADMDALIDCAALAPPLDELAVRRLKKRRLALRDELRRLQTLLAPDAPA